MVSATIFIGGFALYVALLVSEPVAYSLYFALASAFVSAASWIVSDGVSLLMAVGFLALAALSLILNIRRFRLLASLSKLPVTPDRNQPLYTIIVLGSGGHTKEMLYMLSNGFTPHAKAHRRYLISSGDRLSLSHAQSWERATTERFAGKPIGTYDVVIVPRARRVHQGLATVPFTVAQSLLALFPALLGRPEGRKDLGFADVVVSNGPATGFCAIFAAWGMRVLGLVPEVKLRGLYVESWARISSLSLTGKLFRRTKIADRFVVQHEELATKYGLENGGWLVLPQDK